MSEAILQFGGGNFIRSFIDLFIEQTNRRDHRSDQVVIVQSTDSAVAEKLNAQRGVYHVIVRGLRGGQIVDEIEEVRSVSRAIDSRFAWQEVLAFARSPQLRIIVSNTTEAGFALDQNDAHRPCGSAPRSFPAKLLDVLWARCDSGDQQRIAIAPCELLPKNGQRLKHLVQQQAMLWKAPPEVLRYISDNCCWLNSLVDRIVSGKPAEHPLLTRDQLLTMAEPFALWAIERHDGVSLPNHPAINIVDDNAPLELRKIRILNGAHTALVAKAIPLGIKTVREAVAHPEVGQWLRQLLDEEVVPTIEDRVPEARSFVATTLERFANPFLEHKLASIALQHETKVKTRLLPTLQEYESKFGKRPKLLSDLLNGLERTEL